MKTSQVKKAAQVIIVCSVIITAIVLTKNVFKYVKYVYGIETEGSFTNCMFDIIQ